MLIGAVCLSSFLPILIYRTSFIMLDRIIAEDGYI
jgi:hypothetical protein